MKPIDRMMSGSPGVNFITKSDLVANNTAAISREVGCVENDENESIETLSCLRGVPVDILTNLSVSASRAARPPFGEAFFYPTYDGDMITALLNSYVLVSLLQESRSLFPGYPMMVHGIHHLLSQPTKKFWVLLDSGSMVCLILRKENHLNFTRSRISKAWFDQTTTGTFHPSTTVQPK